MSSSIKPVLPAKINFRYLQQQIQTLKIQGSYWKRRKGGAVVTHKCLRTESSKISFFDLQQTKIFESSSFSNRQHHCKLYLVKMGGTGNQMLLKLSKEICQYLLKHQITTTAEYLSIFLNVEAYWKTRNSRDPSEWKLYPKVFQQVCQRRGMPKTDLFGWKLSQQLH